MVWDELGCDNKHLDDNKLAQFYSHPVWILNGLFIEQHALSMQHRNGISQWIADNKMRSVIDYGGGLEHSPGLISPGNLPETDIVIFDPYSNNSSCKQFPEI